MKLLVASLLIVGVCPPASAAEKYRIADESPPAHSIAILDARSPEDIKGGLPLLMDPTYSVPDARFDPPILDVFAAALEQTLGGAMRGRAVVIERLQVQNYFQASFDRNSSTSMIAGAMAAGRVGVAAAAVGIDVASKLKGDRYVDAVRIRISGSVDGSRFSVDLAQPYTPKESWFGMLYNSGPARVATRQIVEQGIAAAVEEIRKGLPAQP